MGAYALILRMCWRGALLEEEGMALCLLARKVEQVTEEGRRLDPGQCSSKPALLY